MERGKAIVFGGTGFLGRQCLLERDFSVRVASRHPERTGVLFPGPRLGIESIYADINDDRSVADALADIGSAVRAVQNSRSEMYYELGGPRVYTYSSLLEVIARSLGKKPLLVPVPFGLWRMLALIAEIFPQPPITRNQVELMQMDNVVSLDAPGFADLQISPRSLEGEYAALDTGGRAVVTETSSVLERCFCENYPFDCCCGASRFIKSELGSDEHVAP
jgi:uncharacterized protein YbjT (DUF2867 family)